MMGDITHSCLSVQTDTELPFTHSLSRTHTHIPAPHSHLLAQNKIATTWQWDNETRGASFAHFYARSCRMANKPAVCVRKVEWSCRYQCIKPPNPCRAYVWRTFRLLATPPSCYIIDLFHVIRYAVLMCEHQGKLELLRVCIDQQMRHATYTYIVHLHILTYIHFYGQVFT